MRLVTSSPTHEFHHLHAPVQGDFLVLDALEGELFGTFVMDVQVRQLATGGGEGVEDGGVRFVGDDVRSL